ETVTAPEGSTPPPTRGRVHPRNCRIGQCGWPIACCISESGASFDLEQDKFIAGREAPSMSKHDESRRAFLIGGATVGAGAVTGLVPDALAQTHAQQQAAPDAPATTAQAHAHTGGHGTFLNDNDVVTVEAFAERIMPGAPGKPRARDARRAKHTQPAP